MLLLMPLDGSVFNIAFNKLFFSFNNFNPHMHKIGPWGPQALYFWRPLLLQKCQEA